MIKNIDLEIDGLGIIIYSPSATSHIKEGEDYLSNYYSTAEQVAQHVNNGTIVGLGTASPGNYHLKFREGYPDEQVLDSADFVLRLGIKVDNQTICIKDLYDLMEWDSFCPDKQTLHVENGNYHITVFSDLPDSGMRGDNQIIHLYLNKLEDFPKIKHNGVPTLD